MWNIINKAQKALAILAMAVGTTTVSAAPAMAQSTWKPNDDDAIFLDIRVGRYRVGDGVTGYQTNKGICVNMTDMVMALDLPVRIDKKSRRATGWLFEEARTFTLDRDLNAVQIVNKSEKLSQTAIYDTPEGWCVDSKAFGRWLNVDLVPDLSNALLIIKADRKLPFELAEERKERAGRIRKGRRVDFDLSKYPQADDAYKLFRIPSIDVNATAVATKAGNGGGSSQAFRYEIFASGEVAGASFDARLFSDQNGVPDSLRMRAYRSDPDGKLLGPLKATQFALGDISTLSTPLGIQSSAGRGAFVTNRPLERAENFDRTTFRGELPAGWDAELYRNDEIIGFTQGSGNGRYEFVDVPLLFGQNRFEVVLYGPQGQLRREVKLIPVGINSIPPQETYYWAGVQETGRDLIGLNNDRRAINSGLRGGFGLERGLDAKTSAGLSYFASTFDGRRRHFLEASLLRALGPALAEFSAASNLNGGYALRGQALAQIGSTNINAEGVYLGGGYQSERFNSGLRHQFNFGIDQRIKVGNRDIPLTFGVLHRKLLDGTTDLDLSSRFSATLGRVTATSEIIWRNRMTTSGADPPDQIDANLRLSGRLAGIRLRGEARFGLSGEDKGFMNSRFTAEKRIDEDSEWRLQAGYDAGARRGVFGGAVTQRFDKFALSAQVELGTNGSVAAGLNLTFSLGPKPGSGGVRFSSQKLAATGQALAIVFHDKNGDGIRQPDEPAEKDVELTAGLIGKGDPTNERGESFIEELQPFKPVLIGIDESSLPDPFVQPAKPGVVVTPRPGIPFVVELPLVSAGEVAGTLKREDGRVLSGVDIELLDENGVVIKTTRSEFDGYFLFESVPYGRYAMRISALAANIVGVDPAISQIAVLDDSNPTAEVGVVIAKHAAKIASAKAPEQEEAASQQQ